MKRLATRLLPALALGLVIGLIGGPYGPAQAGLGAECKSGIQLAKQKIDAMTDPVKKQEADQHRKAAYVDLISGTYQNCLEELKKIDDLAK